MAGTIIKQNTAEGGTNGTAVTTGNSGGASGDAFDLVSAGSGNTLTYDSSTHAVGSLSYKFVQTGANPCQEGWTWVGAQGDFNVRFPIRFSTATPGVTGSILKMFSDNAYTTQVAGVGLTTSGKLRLTDNADGATTADTSAFVAANTWYVAQVRWHAGTTFSITVYALGSTTVVGSASMSVASTASINSAKFGFTIGSMVMTMWTDSLAVGYGGVLARTDLPTPPVAAFTSSVTGTAATVDATTSTGTGLTYAWAFGDGGTATGATPAAHTYAAAGTYTVTLTVTDSSTQTNTTSGTVTIAAPGTSAGVVAIVSSAGWTANTGTVLSALSDQDLTTFVTSSGNPVGLPLQVRIANKSAPGAGVGLVATVPIERLSSASGSFTCKLIDSDGTTVRSTVTSLAIPVGTGGSIDPTHIVTASFPASEVATVVDWSGVVVEVDATAA